MLLMKVERVSHQLVSRRHKTSLCDGKQQQFCDPLKTWKPLSPLTGAQRRAAEVVRLNPN